MTRKAASGVVMTWAPRTEPMGAAAYAQRLRSASRPQRSRRTTCPSNVARPSMASSDGSGGYDDGVDMTWTPLKA